MTRRVVHEPDAVGIAASLTCGCFIRFYLSLDEGSVVTNVGISSNGCGYMLAAADILAEFVAGRPLADLHGLNGRELHTSIAEILGVLPYGRADCLETAIEALRAAFADLRAKRVEEFRGEAALICSCFGVSQDTIEATINEKALETVEEVTAVCRAGGGCGSCRMLIQELLDLRHNFG